MFVTAVAVMCKLLVAQPTLAPDGDCTAEEFKTEEVMADSDQDPNLDFVSCQIGWPMASAEWKGKHRTYASSAWRVARVKCLPGHYIPKGQA
jgi:hypothetical protein